MAAKSRRSRQAGILLGLLCALCFAVILYLVVRFVNKQNSVPPAQSGTDSSVESEVQNETLISDFYFDDAVFFSYRSARQEETVSYSYDGSLWHWDGDDSFPVNNSMLNSMLYTVTNMQFSRTFSAELADRSAFGLETPTAAVTVIYRTYNGKTAEYEILFGIKNETLQATYVQCTQTGKEPIYCMVEGDAAAFLAYTFLETADPSVVPQFAALNLSSVVVTAPESAANTVFSGDSAAARAINAIEPLRITAFKPDEEALLQYGLDSAHAVCVTLYYDEVLEVTSQDGSSYLLTVPRELDLLFGAVLQSNADCCYFTVQDTHLVYVVSAAFLQAIAQ